MVEELFTQVNNRYQILSTPASGTREALDELRPFHCTPLLAVDPPLSVTRGRSVQVATPVAVVHDYLTQRGGAERVVSLMLDAFPEAPLYTSLYSGDHTFGEFAGKDIRPFAINRLALFRRNHRLAFPLLAPVFSRERIHADVTVCSSSGWAHGVRTTGRKLVYCYAPARWLYQAERYLGEPSDHDSSSGAAYWKGVTRQRVARLALKILCDPLRRWDRRAAASADRYLTSSSVMAAAIKQVYGIDAEVLPPPPGLTPEGAIEPVPGVEPGYFLCVARLLPYKNVESVIDAMECVPGLRLVIVGDGPLRQALADRAGTNVHFVGVVEDANLRWLYQHCLALVAASHEDYGLTPLEAASFGRPSIVLRAGGFLDTVEEGVSGLFFDEPSAEAIAPALRAASEIAWDRQSIVAHAKSFAKEAFIGRLKEVVREVRMSDPTHTGAVPPAPPRHALATARRSHARSVAAPAAARVA
jgi:glycosyltransferase involved in cell wall biosynthesis